MTAAEYIQEVQLLVEFHMKATRYFIGLRKTYPWLVKPDMQIEAGLTVYAPIHDEGMYAWDAELFSIFFVEKNGSTFTQIKEAIIKQYMDLIYDAGYMYCLIMSEQSHLTTAPIIDVAKIDVSKGFKKCMGGVCEKFDAAVKELMKNESS